MQRRQQQPEISGEKGEEIERDSRRGSLVVQKDVSSFPPSLCPSMGFADLNLGPRERKQWSGSCGTQRHPAGTPTPQTQTPVCIPSHLPHDTKSHSSSLHAQGASKAEENQLQRQKYMQKKKKKALPKTLGCKELRVSGTPLSKERL